MAINFPYPAVTAITEELEWPCSVVRSASGDEERVAYRELPIARYSYSVKLDNFEQLDNARRDSRNFGWHQQFIPLWHAYGEFDDWSWEYGRNAAVANLETSMLTEVTTSSVGSLTPSERASVIPLRDGWFTGDLDNSAYGASATMQFRGETTSTPMIVGTRPIRDFQGLELYYAKISGAVEHGSQYNRLNYVTPRGQILVSSEQRAVRVTKRYTFKMFTPLEQREFKAFLYRRQGRRNPCYMEIDSGHVTRMRLDTDKITINHSENIATCTVPFIEIY